jgi:hypothetical protein
VCALVDDRNTPSLGFARRLGLAVGERRLDAGMAQVFVKLRAPSASHYARVPCGAGSSPEPRAR